MLFISIAIYNSCSILAKSMVNQLFFLIVGLLMLVIGSNYLLKSSVDLSLKYKISKVVIGLTVVSIATSAPELLISISSVLKNSSDIAISNVIGSNIANFGLVLGLALFFSKIKINNKLIYQDWNFLMISSVIFSLFAITKVEISRIEGLVLFTLLISSLVYIFRNSNGEELSLNENNRSNTKLIALILISSLMLYFGSEFFVDSSIYFADYFGVSERIIGLTIVAIGTSLPEVVTTLVAVFKKELDISIGNIIGSNIFNILAVIGVTSIIKPLKISNKLNLQLDLSIMFVFMLFLFLFYSLSKTKILGRIHGVILLGSFIIYYIIII
ncbi:MAG: calcium/sodium antiporter [Flavobacteriaceae bacterium]